MTKADLVEKVTRLGDLTRRDGEVIVETIFDSVIGALQSGDKIEIRGFGSFRIRQRNPRIGRNDLEAWPTLLAGSWADPGGGSVRQDARFPADSPDRATPLTA